MRCEHIAAPLDAIESLQRHSHLRHNRGVASRRRQVPSHLPNSTSGVSATRVSNYSRNSGFLSSCKSGQRYQPSRTPTIEGVQ